MAKFSGYGYEMEELREKIEGFGIKVDAELKMENRKVSGLATPEDIADAVTLGYANNNYMNKSTDNIISGNNTFTGENTFTGDTIFSNTITGDISGNAETVTDGVYTTGDQTIGGNKTFSNTITGDISGNAETVTNGVYTTGDQTIGGNKTFSNTITGDISGNAGTVTDGVYTTGDQTIGGNKTFDSTITGNISGNAGTVTNGVYTTGDQTISGIKTFSDSIAVDTISEGAGADGVTVDGVKLKDGGGIFTGNVGIGAISPKAQLSVGSAGKANFFASSASAYDLAYNAYYNTGFKRVSSGKSWLTQVGDESYIIYHDNVSRSADENGAYAEYFKVNSDGIVSMPKQSSARGYLTTNQSIPDSIQTTAIFNAESYDTQSEFNTSTGVFTAKTAGRYSIKTSIIFTSSNAGIRNIVIYVNSTTVSAASANAVNGTNHTLSCSTDVSMNIGDTIRVDVLQTSGGALNILASGITSLSIAKLH